MDDRDILSSVIACHPNHEDQMGQVVVEQLSSGTSCPFFKIGRGNSLILRYRELLDSHRQNRTGTHIQWSLIIKSTLSGLMNNLSQSINHIFI